MSIVVSTVYSHVVQIKCPVICLIEGVEIRC